MIHEEDSLEGKRTRGGGGNSGKSLGVGDVIYEISWIVVIEARRFLEGEWKSEESGSMRILQKFEGRGNRKGQGTRVGRLA